MNNCLHALWIRLEIDGPVLPDYRGAHLRSGQRTFLYGRLDPSRLNAYCQPLGSGIGGCSDLVSIVESENEFLRVFGRRIQTEQFNQDVNVGTADRKIL